MSDRHPCECDGCPDEAKGRAPKCFACFIADQKKRPHKHEDDSMRIARASLRSQRSFARAEASYERQNG